MTRCPPPRPSDRNDAVDLVEWLAALRGITTTEAHGRMNAARADCDAMRCPACGEQGVHRCDR